MLFWVLAILYCAVLVWGLTSLNEHGFIENARVLVGIGIVPTAGFWSLYLVSGKTVHEGVSIGYAMIAGLCCVPVFVLSIFCIKKAWMISPRYRLYSFATVLFSVGGCTSPWIFMR